MDIKRITSGLLGFPLVLAVLLQAGLEGIKNNLEVEEETVANIFAMSDRERKEAGIDNLPNNLYEAVNFMKESELAKKALGEHIYENYVEAKVDFIYPVDDKDKNKNQIEIRNQLRKWNLAIDLSFGYDPTICSCGGNLIFFELKIKDPEILKSTRLPLYNI